jgi:hypothetical protein
LHTCQSTFGYSGGPILVRTGGREMEVAGIQIAAMKSDGTEKMIAVPAQAIGHQDRDEDVEVVVSVCGASSNGESVAPLAAIRARLDLDRPEVISSNLNQGKKPVGAVVAWLPEPSAVATP